VKREISESLLSSSIYENFLLPGVGLWPTSHPGKPQKRAGRNGRGYNLIIKVLDFQEQGDTAHAVGTWETEDENGSWLDVVQRQGDDSLLFRRVCWNVS